MPRRGRERKLEPTGAFVDPAAGLFADRDDRTRHFVEPLRLNGPFLVANGVDPDAVYDLEKLDLQVMYEQLMDGFSYASMGSRVTSTNFMQGAIALYNFERSAVLGSTLVNGVPVDPSVMLDARSVWTSMDLGDRALNFATDVMYAKPGNELPKLATNLTVADESGSEITEWTITAFNQTGGMKFRSAKIKELVTAFATEKIVSRLELRTNTMRTERNIDKFEQRDVTSVLDELETMVTTGGEQVVNAQACATELIMCIVAARLGAYAPILCAGSTASLHRFFMLQAKLNQPLNIALTKTWLTAVVEEHPDFGSLSQSERGAKVIEVEIALLSNAIRCFRILSRARMLTCSINPVDTLTASAVWQQTGAGETHLACEVYITRLPPTLTQFVDLPDDYSEWFMLSMLFIAIAGAEREEDGSFNGSGFLSEDGKRLLQKALSLSYDHRRDRAIEVRSLENAMRRLWDAENFSFDVPVAAKPLKYGELVQSLLPVPENADITPVFKGAPSYAVVTIGHLAASRRIRVADIDLVASDIVRLPDKGEAPAPPTEPPPIDPNAPPPPPNARPLAVPLPTPGRTPPPAQGLREEVQQKRAALIARVQDTFAESLEEKLQIAQNPAASSLRSDGSVDTPTLRGGFTTVMDELMEARRKKAGSRTALTTQRNLEARQRDAVLADVVRAAQDDVKELDDDGAALRTAHTTLTNTLKQMQLAQTELRSIDREANPDAYGRANEKLGAAKKQFDAAKAELDVADAEREELVAAREAEFRAKRARAKNSRRVTTDPRRKQNREDARTDQLADSLIAVVKSKMDARRGSIAGGDGADSSSDEWEDIQDMGAPVAWKLPIPKANFRSAARRSASVGSPGAAWWIPMGDGSTPKDEMTPESYKFASTMHKAVLQVARQFVQRWVDTTADSLPMNEIVRLVVRDDTLLPDMLSANDLLARMVFLLLDQGVLGTETIDLRR
jgi:hypothetical protein